MIDPATSMSTVLATPRQDVATGEPRGAFDAALKAEQEAAARAEARQKERDAIAEKGFSTWVRDTKIEQLKEKLRRMVMAEMGLDEKSLAQMDSAMRRILEQKVEEEVARRMEETARDDESDKDGTKAQSDQKPGKNDRAGISCPVIPALVWPGGVVL